MHMDENGGFKILAVKTLMFKIVIYFKWTKLGTFQVVEYFEGPSTVQRNERLLTQQWQQTSQDLSMNFTNR